MRKWIVILKLYFIVSGRVIMFYDDTKVYERQYVWIDKHKNYVIKTLCAIRSWWWGRIAPTQIITHSKIANCYFSTSSFK